MSGAVNILACSDLDRLLEELVAAGFELIGPVAGQGAIAFEPIRSAADLPIGLVDEQEGGTYRLRDRGDEAVFGFANGPQSWKRLLHPPVLSEWSARRNADGHASSSPRPSPTRVGRWPSSACGRATCMRSRPSTARSLRSSDPDPHYVARRDGIFVVALNCSTAGGTCFCVSMNTGPEVDSGYDLVLTEVVDGDRHHFLIDVGKRAGC